MSNQSQSTPRTKTRAQGKYVLIGAGLATLTTILAAILTGCGRSTDIPTGTSEVISSAVPTPILDVENHLIRLIDQYYTCINFADPNVDDDYEECWNFLSNEPGEYQAYFGLEDFTAFWKPYNVAYLLYYCPRETEHFLNAETYLHSSSDLLVSRGKGQKLIIEYSFAASEEGWRIKSGTAIGQDIRPYCERQPRIRKLTLPY
jgi:hypothetical protein